MEDSTKVLDGSPIELTINGKTYTAHSHPRRIQRKARARFLEVVDMVAEIETGELSDIGKTSMLIDAVNALLEFCEEFVPEIADDIDAVEDYIESDGVSSINAVLEGLFQPLFDGWVKPWISPEESEGN